MKALIIGLMVATFGVANVVMADETGAGAPPATNEAPLAPESNVAPMGEAGAMEAEKTVKKEEKTATKKHHNKRAAKKGKKPHKKHKRAAEDTMQ